MADLDFAYDLTLDEPRRRTAVLEAIGADWDPVAVLAEEEKAYAMLYSNLDEEQHVRRGKHLGEVLLTMNALAAIKRLNN